MDKQHIELYIGTWIDNNDGVYTPTDITCKMKQISLKCGVPKEKLPSHGEVYLFQENIETIDFSAYEEYNLELQREMEDLLNEYCTTDRPCWAIMDNGWKIKVSEAVSTCWAWNDNAFGLWYASDIYDEELA